MTVDYGPRQIRYDPTRAMWVGSARSTHFSFLNQHVAAGKNFAQSPSQPLLDTAGTRALRGIVRGYDARADAALAQMWRHPEPAHDPSAEERDVPPRDARRGGGGRGGGVRPPSASPCSARTRSTPPIALPLGYRRVACSTNAEHCTPEHLRAAADAIEKAAAAAPSSSRSLVAPADVASDDALASAVDRVASALRVDAVDLATLEWPSKDPAELERAWRRMEALVMSGKVRAIGLANASVPTVETIRASCAVAPAAIEVETHPLMAQRKLAGVCRRYGVQPSAIAPLGAMNRALLEHPKLLEAAAMEDKADGEKTRRRSPAALLLRWSAQRGVPFVVDAGASAG